MNNVKQSNLDKSTVKDNEKYIANAVNVIFIRKDPQTNKPQIAIHQRLASNKAGYMQWALPGGTQEAGETTEETALREMSEEVGVKMTKYALNNMFECITEIEKNGEIKLLHFNHFCYVCEEWEGDFKNNEPEKHSDLEWCDIDALPLDNFFITKGNVVNFVNGQFYNPAINLITRVEKAKQKDM